MGEESCPDLNNIFLYQQMYTALHSTQMALLFKNKSRLLSATRFEILDTRGYKWHFLNVYKLEWACLLIMVARHEANIGLNVDMVTTNKICIKV